jgi:RNA polymerase sigma factor (sigma-70 family)
MQRHPDRELIRLVQRGSRDAAGALFDRYWLFAWRAAYAVTMNRTQADDAAQEAIQRAFGNLGRFDPTRPFGPWLKRIAINCACDQLRRARGSRALEEEPPPEEWPDGDVGAEEALELRAVVQAVRSLSPAKRAVVALRYWLDLPFEEIGGVLGVPVGTVASRHSRALAELRATLSESDVV